MNLTALIIATLPAATSAWTSFSIAQGLPIRRSVAKFTEDKVPEDAVTKAAEGKSVYFGKMILMYMNDHGPLTFVGPENITSNFVVSTMNHFSP